MGWKRILLLTGIVLILGACNAKPVEEEIVEIKEEFIEIENPEKMFESEIIFKDTSNLQAIEKLMMYYDVPITGKDLKSIEKTNWNEKDSTLDGIQLTRTKGIPVLPLFTTYDVLEEAVLKGKPVYSEFTLIGDNLWKVIFYGYSEDQFAYLDFETGEKKSVDRKRLETVPSFKAIIPYEKEELPVAELEKSWYYFELAAIDAYDKDDGEQLLKYLTLIENEKVEEHIWRYRFLSMYYYTFHDFQPEIVDPILESDPNYRRNPGVMEITIRMADYHNDDDLLKSYLSTLQVLPFYRPETLEFIIRKGTEFGYTELVAEAEEMLKSRVK
jgi:hypothetical protein